MLFCRYTPAQQGVAYNSGAKQRIIRMVEAQKDPMEPPRFKVNQKIPRGPPSPPAPVLHSPTRKVGLTDHYAYSRPQLTVTSCVMCHTGDCQGAARVEDTSLHIQLEEPQGKCIFKYIQLADTS